MNSGSLRARLRNLTGRAYRTVHPHEAVALLGEGAVLLDVREAAEWAAGHAPQARHIPLDRLSARLHELPHGRPVVTVCRSGSRSARAAALLAQSGHDVADVAGGMLAWVRAGHGVVGKHGRPGRVA